MLLVDRSGRIIEANVPASRLFRPPLDAMIGKRVGDLARARHRRVARESTAEADAAHKKGPILTIKRQDKTTLDVVVRDVRHILPGMRVRILRAATAERPVAEALESTTRLLRDAERVGRIGAWQIDLQAGLVVRTPELCRIMEVPATARRTSIEESYQGYTEASRSIAREAFTATMTRGTPYDLELEVVTGRGNRLWVREICRATMRRGRLVSVIGILQDISARRRLVHLLTDAASQERARIGADLHDGLGQDLTGLALLLRSAARRAESGDGRFAQELGELASLASKAVKTARAMAHGMLPVGLSDGGFAGALQRLCRSTSAAFSVPVTARYGGDKRYGPDGTTAENLYRIAQEAITNAVKHAHPKRVSIFVRTSETHTVLIVSNDGDRIDLRRATEGMGLQTMRHRAHMLGGLLDVQPVRKGGTRVRCVVPRSGIG
jgi:signal transduction histidine kinase